MSSWICVGGWKYRDGGDGLKERFGQREEVGMGECIDLQLTRRFTYLDTIKFMILLNWRGRGYLPGKSGCS